jgi:N-acyl-D-aspartate/D-glutamate deacylase
LLDNAKFDLRCDALIRGAEIVDGSGGPTYHGDIAIAGQEIVRIGKVENVIADHVIDATGLCAAPGFIDVHTHDDWAVLQTPDMPFKTTQGVTTVIVGNCGVSAAPFVPRAGLPAPFGIVPDIAHHSSASVAEYARNVTTTTPAVNVLLLVGHSTLRACAMQDSLDRPATPEEIEQMARLLDQALRDGATGFSTGLDYPAASNAPMEEVVTLARVVASHGSAVYTTHIRDEADHVIEAVEEALKTAKDARVPLLLSHHKCAGTRNFGKSVRTLSIIDKARQSQDVAMDVYPYNASSSALLPHFAEAAPEVLVIWSTAHPECGGRMLDDIAEDWGLSRAEAIAKLTPAAAVYFDMDEEDVQRILCHPATMIGSDGIPGTQKPHPRLWGTFPRVLGHYARDLGLMSLAAAVHKMTGLSAKRFGLTDRGLLKPGMAADIVLFDAATVIDKANFEDSELQSTGIVHVMVNGQLTLKNGQQTSVRSGRFIERKEG